mmetsp:Transcript_7852/g.8996  ORF Transcript_7852/g.8996 Transcript_7852/m.8996 type:complete len:343 (-) Transcript_7852:71-1099(-)
MIRRVIQPLRKNANSNDNKNSNNKNEDEQPPTKTSTEALKHLFCGGVAGSTAKTLTAPLSRLTILYQVHSLVTTKKNRPKYAMKYNDGLRKIIERGTSVLHRFPFSAINFYVYDSMLGILLEQRKNRNNSSTMDDDPSAYIRMISGAVAGCTACVACYPLDLIRTRLTKELPGKEHYKGISDALQKILQTEGVSGLYAGLGPTLFVAVPNFAISYTVYGTLNEYALDDDLFYNLRKVDVDSGEESLGFKLSLLCGAASGTLSTLITFPFDTIRRRMQIQSLHVDLGKRLNGFQQARYVLRNEGVGGLYRGLPPEMLKVIPMVGTLFTVYEFLKDELNVKSKR